MAVNKIVSDEEWLEARKALVETVANDLLWQRFVVIAEKKGFFGGKKERNND